jgi:inhibitor of cysteine peptidase
MLSLGPADAGTDIVLETGNSFVVRLPENASTGYQWEIVERPVGLECLADRSVPARGLTPGAAGVHEFEFALPPGLAQPPHGQLVLHLRRSWDTTREPVETYTVTLVSP